MNLVVSPLIRQYRNGQTEEFAGAKPARDVLPEAVYEAAVKRRRGQRGPQEDSYQEARHAPPGSGYHRGLQGKGQRLAGPDE